MREDILQYLWQFGNFSTKPIFTSENEKIEIYSKGILNINEGPDFLHAKIKIGEIEWAGSVEIHVKSSDWNLHKHSNHKAYENVILHVVYENNKPIFDAKNKLIPTLELKQIIDNEMLKKYYALINNQSTLACASHFSNIESVIKLSMFDGVLHRRLERKAVEIITQFQKYNADWEQTCYHFLLRNFGFKTNAEPFARLAELLPYKIIQKQSENRIQIEALLFGIAGFLDETPKDDYQKELTKEFAYLCSKHNLTNKLNRSEWKFFRLRPHNFPTVRIAQLAGILQHNQNLNRVFFETKKTKEIAIIFKINPSPYWQKHINFGDLSKRNLLFSGKQSIENVVINTICQTKAAYGIWKDNSDLIADSVLLLENLPAEDNKITRIFENTGTIPKSAYDSQAMIELYNEFCVQKKCLKCSIGQTILKENSV